MDSQQYNDIKIDYKPRYQNVPPAPATPRPPTPPSQPVYEAPEQREPLPALKSVRRTDRIIKALSFLLVLAIIGAGAVLALGYFDPQWNPLRVSPEKMIGLMAQKMSEVNTNHSEVNISVAAQDLKSAGDFVFQLNIASDSDRSNEENPKGQAEVMVNADVDKDSVEAKLKTIFINQDVYVNLEKMDIPIIPFELSSYQSDISKMLNIWVKLPLIEESQTDNGVANISEILQDAIKNSLAGSQDKFIQLYAFEKRLPDQNIGGQKIYSYLISLDNDKLLQLFDDLIGLQGDELGGSMVAGMAKGLLGEMLDKIGKIEIQLDIGKNDYFLYGISLEKEIDLSQLESSLAGMVKLSFDMKNSDFGKPVEITAPADFKSYEEIFPKSKNDQVIMMMNQLRDDIENVKISTSDLSTISCQVMPLKTICDQIKAITGIYPAINKSKNYYCAYIKLPYESGQMLTATDPKYFCVDVLGNAKATITHPGMAGYCSLKTYKCPAQ